MEISDLPWLAANLRFSFKLSITFSCLNFARKSCSVFSCVILVFIASLYVIGSRRSWEGCGVTENLCLGWPWVFAWLPVNWFLFTIPQTVNIAEPNLVWGHGLRICFGKAVFLHLWMLQRIQFLENGPSCFCLRLIWELPDLRLLSCWAGQAFLLHGFVSRFFS